MGEVPCGTQEAGVVEQQELSRDVRVTEGLEAVLDDVLEALHVDEVEGQRAAAGGVEAGEAVLVAEAQELLGLAQLRPREGPGEELLGEATDVLPLPLRLADRTIGIAHRVGGALGRVVVVVGGATALRDAAVGGDALAVDEDPDELRVAAHPHLLAHVAGGNRVKALPELDVVIRMDLGLGPHGGIEALGPERAGRFARAYGVDAPGNFEAGTSVLWDLEIGRAHV